VLDVKKLPRYLSDLLTHAITAVVERTIYSASFLENTVLGEGNGNGETRRSREPS
jgi:hypothetical protein